MSVKTADRQFAHLYPPFADRLMDAIYQATQETAGKHGVHHWVLVEGFRSQARQDWLYAQGRTRRGEIVTHTKKSNHSKGLAGDCYPVDAHGNVMWEAHEEVWQQFGHCVRTQEELQWGGDFPTIHPGSTFVDRPHVEPKLGWYGIWYAKAQEYLKGLGLI